ncbi:MAG: biosynthetic-type acetolactate synthase large subunit [Candidatus Bathyarchaeota archaeon]|nr:biosynthetic-type acetolactate synthase large subunit [Candidatus Bathyarchaeota archaeon]MDH5532198.1 biosynthetic-type acetolactate synthase large subunit [Candidatus Bathyarchaeota archaeon]MDH5713369.1 biosynthetic-type acetolactate synthase large subunit [Candidatus Bathyarchaeota archaeon]
MTKMSGAQAVVEALKRQKVEAIFGIIGGAVLPIYDVLYETPEIRHILARHEQCAAHAADGYARASGRPGVCMATSGPGATNLVTGIANAYMDSSPIIALTGQVNAFAVNSSYLIGKDAFQEADIIGITTPVTKYNYQPKKASEIPKIVKQAFYIATTGRPGPVLIDLPKNVQSETAEMKFTDNVEIRGYKPKTDPHLGQVKKAVELLFKAERPVILAGGGIIASNASPELLALAELLMSPVTTPLMGKGCFPENHPLSLGNLGMHGTRAATKLILEADVLLAVGTRFSDRTTGKLDEFCPDAKIIHIDIDTAEIGKNVDVDIPIVADAKKALKEIYKYLTKKLQKKESSQWFKRVQEVKDQLKDEVSGGEKDLKPPRLIKELRKILPNNAIVTTEVGQNQMWAALHFTAYEPRTFISSGGLGTMGFGFPASIGAKVACPDRPVVDIAGDGSFRMTEQDLACSVQEKIPVTVIVLNNSVLGMVAQWQRLFYGRRYSAVNLGSVPDFVKLAEAYGAKGTRVGSLKEFSNAVRKAIKSEVTTVIDVPISPEENVFPMIPAGAGLKGMVKSEEEL